MVPFRILLIDESPRLLDVCRVVLNGHFHPSTLLDPSLAIELLERGEIQLVVVSSTSSDPETLQTLTRLKKRFPSVSLVLATDDTSPDFVIKTFQCGINDIIKKPVEPMGLLTSLCRLSDLPKSNGSTPFAICHLNQLPTFDDENVLYSPDGITPHAVSLYEKGVQSVRSLAGKLLRAPFNNSGTTFHRASHHDSSNPFSGQHNGTPVATNEEPDLFSSFSSNPKIGYNVTSNTLRVHFLGSFRVEINNRRIDKWTSHKSKMLCSFLLLNHQRRLSRDVLMNRFWPHVQPESSRNSLNVAIHTLRQALHRLDDIQDYVLFDHECYLINPYASLWTDVDEFMRHRKQARLHEAEKNMSEVIWELEQAKNLYAGDFMEEEPYDDWASIERENLKEMYVAVLERLSDCYLSDRKPQLAADVCHMILEKDNCREDIHRRLMYCYYQLGSRTKALRQFKKCVKNLDDELQVDPTRSTLKLFEQIKHGTVPPYRQTHPRV